MKGGGGCLYLTKVPGIKVEILDEWKRNFKVANKMSCAAAF